MNVNVVACVGPFTSSVGDPPSCVSATPDAPGSLRIAPVSAHSHQKEPRVFTFSDVVGDGVAESDVYDATTAALVEDATAGVDAALLVFGQTSDGKGRILSDVLPFLSVHLFRLLQLRTEASAIATSRAKPARRPAAAASHKAAAAPATPAASFSVTLSFVELHLEHVYDLLLPTLQKQSPLQPQPRARGLRKSASSIPTGSLLLPASPAPVTGRSITSASGSKPLQSGSARGAASTAPVAGGVLSPRPSTQLGSPPAMGPRVADSRNGPAPALSSLDTSLPPTASLLEPLYPPLSSPEPRQNERQGSLSPPPPPPPPTPLAASAAAGAEEPMHTARTSNCKSPGSVSVTPQRTSVTRVSTGWSPTPTSDPAATTGTPPTSRPSLQIRETVSRSVFVDGAIILPCTSADALHSAVDAVLAARQARTDADGAAASIAPADERADPSPPPSRRLPPSTHASPPSSSHAIGLIVIEQSMPHASDCASFAASLHSLKSGSPVPLYSLGACNDVAATPDALTLGAPMPEGCSCIRRGLQTQLRTHLALVDVAGAETLWVAQPSQPEKSVTAAVSTPRVAVSAFSKTSPPGRPEVSVSNRSIAALVTVITALGHNAEAARAGVAAAAAAPPVLPSALVRPRSGVSRVANAAGSPSALPPIPSSTHGPALATMGRAVSDPMSPGTRASGDAAGRSGIPRRAAAGRRRSSTDRGAPQPFGQQAPPGGRLIAAAASSPADVGSTALFPEPSTSAERTESLLTSPLPVPPVDCSQPLRVPYRESKLTRLLQRFLGVAAAGRVTLLLAVSPHERDAAQTLATLRFGERAMRIRDPAWPIVGYAARTRVVPPLALDSMSTADHGCLTGGTTDACDGEASAGASSYAGSVGPSASSYAAQAQQAEQAAADAADAADGAADAGEGSLPSAHSVTCVDAATQTEGVGGLAVLMSRHWEAPQPPTEGGALPPLLTRWLRQGNRRSARQRRLRLQDSRSPPHAQATRHLRMRRASRSSRSSRGSDSRSGAGPPSAAAAHVALVADILSGARARSKPLPAAAAAAEDEEEEAPPAVGRTGAALPDASAGPELPRHEAVAGEAAEDRAVIDAAAAAAPFAAGDEGPRLSADDGSLPLLDWNFDDVGEEGGGGGELDDDDASVATADIVQDMMFDAGAAAAWVRHLRQQHARMVAEVRMLREQQQLLQTPAGAAAMLAAAAQIQSQAQAPPMHLVSLEEAEAMAAAAASAAAADTAAKLIPTPSAPRMPPDLPASFVHWPPEGSGALLDM